MLAHLRVLGIILDVVVAVGQGETTLIHVGNHHVRIVEIRRRIKPEQAVRADHVRVCNDVNERRLVGCGRHPIQLRLERIQSLRIRRLLIHARPEIVADLLLDRAPRRSARSCLLENASEGDEIPFIQFREADPLCLIRGNFRLLQPVPAGILIKIGTGIDRPVDGLDAESRISAGILRERPYSREGKACRTHCHQHLHCSHRTSQAETEDCRRNIVRRISRQNVNLQNPFRFGPFIYGRPVFYKPSLGDC